MGQATSRTDIKKVPVKLPGENEKLAFVLENVLTKEECEELIRITEEQGYEPALLSLSDGSQILDTGVRKSSRCIWDSFEKADWLWQRIKEYIPLEFKNRKVIGLNERLRFLRYDPGEYFKPHFDGSYERENGEISLITFHLYLNEGYSGGCTTFLKPYEKSRRYDVPVKVKAGMVLIFEHAVLHEGSILKSGRKYTMRTDVMYSKETLQQMNLSACKED